MTIQQSYREATVRGASPVDLVVRLYEQAIEDLRQAAIALEQKDIERRSDRIKHALLVVGHLQSSLDFENGGKVSQHLNQFYDGLRQNLVWVQFHPSKPALTQQITDLLAVREAWIEVERKERMPNATGAEGRAVSAFGAGETSTPRRMDRKG
jgi:flagellar protein FliS